MASRSKKAVAPEPAGVDAEAVMATYAAWLKRQPLATRSRDAYLAQVRSFLMWLAGSEHGALALSEPAVRDWAVRDYKPPRQDGQALGAGVGEPGPGRYRQLLPVLGRRPA